MDIDWDNVRTLESLDFECGHCGNHVGSNKGYFPNRRLDGLMPIIYICPHCARPNYFHGETRVPDIIPGSEVESVPESVNNLYVEARKCVSFSAYTASVLSSRKLLMNLAVNEGADEGLRFIEYINYLVDNGFVPPNGRGWVDHIRKKGNEATHEIPEMSREDACELVSFSEMLLKFIYEFPARIPAH